MSFVFERRVEDVATLAQLNQLLAAFDALEPTRAQALTTDASLGPQLTRFHALYCHVLAKAANAPTPAAVKASEGYSSSLEVWADIGRDITQGVGNSVSSVTSSMTASMTLVLGGGEKSDDLPEKNDKSEKGVLKEGETLAGALDGLGLPKTLRDVSLPSLALFEKPFFSEPLAPGLPSINATRSAAKHSLVSGLSSLGSSFDDFVTLSTNPRPSDPSKTTKKPLGKAAPAPVVGPTQNMEVNGEAVHLSTATTTTPSTNPVSSRPGSAGQGLNNPPPGSVIAAAAGINSNISPPSNPFADVESSLGANTRVVSRAKVELGSTVQGEGSESSPSDSDSDSDDEKSPTSFGQPPKPAVSASPEMSSVGTGESTNYNSEGEKREADSPAQSPIAVVVNAAPEKTAQELAMEALERTRAENKAREDARLAQLLQLQEQRRKSKLAAKQAGALSPTSLQPASLKSPGLRSIADGQPTSPPSAVTAFNPFGIPTVNITSSEAPAAVFNPFGSPSQN